MQLDKYVRQNIEQPQRVQYKPVQGAAVSRPDLPNTPGDPANNTGQLVGLMQLGKQAYQLFSNMNKDKQEADAKEAFLDDQNDIYNTVAEAVAGNDIDNLQDNVNSVMEDLISKRTEDLGKHGIQQYRLLIKDFANSSTRKELMSRAISENKRAAQTWQDNLNMYVQDGDFSGAVGTLIQGAADERFDTREIGIDPAFWEASEFYDPEDLSRAIQDGQLDIANNIITDAIRGGYYEEDGMISQVKKDIDYYSAIEDMNIVAETSAEYAEITQRLDDTDEEGNFTVYPNVTTPEQREKLFNYANGKYKDLQIKEKQQLEQMESAVLNDLNDAYMNWSINHSMLQEAMGQVETSSARAEIRGLMGALEQRVDNSKLEMESEAVVRFSEFDQTWREDVLEGKFSPDEAIKIYSRALDTYSPTHQRAIKEEYNFTAAARFAQSNSERVKRTGIYEEIESLDIPLDMKNRIKTRVAEYMTSSIWDENMNVKDDAPSIDQLQIGARNIINDIVEEQGNKEMKQLIEETFGTTTIEYSRDKFMKGADADPTSGFLGRGQKEDFEAGLKMLNAGHFIGSTDPEEEAAMLKYFGKMREMYTKQWGEPVKEKINGGMIFFEGKDGVTRTLMMPKGSGTRWASPEWATAEEFSKHYFTPGTVLEDLGVTTNTNQDSLFAKYGNYTGYGVVKRTANGDVVFTKDGWKPLTDVQDSIFEDDDGSMRIHVAGYLYPLMVLEPEDE